MSTALGNGPHDGKKSSQPDRGRQTAPDGVNRWPQPDPGSWTGQPDMNVGWRGQGAIGNPYEQMLQGGGITGQFQDPAWLQQQSQFLAGQGQMQGDVGSSWQTQAPGMGAPGQGWQQQGGPGAPPVPTGPLGSWQSQGGPGGHPGAPPNAMQQSGLGLQPALQQATNQLMPSTKSAVTAAQEALRSQAGRMGNRFSTDLQNQQGQVGASMMNAMQDRALQAALPIYQGGLQEFMQGKELRSGDWRAQLGSSDTRAGYGLQELMQRNQLGMQGWEGQMGESNLLNQLRAQQAMGQEQIGSQNWQQTQQLRQGEALQRGQQSQADVLNQRNMYGQMLGQGAQTGMEWNKLLGQLNESQVARQLPLLMQFLTSFPGLGGGGGAGATSGWGVNIMQ